jgi:hypothetical protein
MLQVNFVALDEQRALLCSSELIPVRICERFLVAR